MAKTTVRKLSDEVPRNARALPNVSNSRPALTAKGIEAYDGMTLEQVRAKAEAEFAKEATKERGLDVSAAIDVWLEKHPEYANVDGNTSQKNAAAIVRELSSPESMTEMQRGGRLVPDAHAPKGFRFFPNLWDVAMAAGRAEAKGELTANQGEAYKQRCEAVRQQVSLPRTEADLEAMADAEITRRTGAWR